MSLTDSTQCPTITQNFNNTVSVSFPNPKLTTITSGYTITRFEKVAPNSRFEHIRRIYVVEADSLTRLLLTQLRGADSLLFTDINEIRNYVDVSYTPNDYHNYPTSVSNYLDYIRARDAWGITKGDPNIVVAVHERDGYQQMHPDLIGKVVMNTGGLPTYISGNHGNRVLGLIAGATDNSIGTPSIGFNIKLHHHNFGTPSQLLSVVKTHKRRIINVSYGGWTYNANDEDLWNEIYEEGTLTVAGAGNGWYTSDPDAPWKYFYPASYDNVLSVSSICHSNLIGSTNLIDSHEEQLGDSTKTHNHNDRVDILAPGFLIGGHTASSPWYNATPSVFDAGTSFAAPLVSGTAGLLLSVKSCLSPYQLEYALKQQANQAPLALPQNAWYSGRLGAGKLDAYASVLYADASFDTRNGRPAPDACNDPATQTKHIAGIDFNTLCAPGIAANGVAPKFKVIVENGKPPFVYRWEAISGNTSTLDAYDVSEPTVVSSTANASGDHIAYFRVVVYDNSEVRKEARRFIKVTLHTDPTKSDLAVRDSYMDMLDEPNGQINMNMRDWQIWQSPDLWMRTLPDGDTVHENPEFMAASPNQVYVRIRNVGCAAYDNAVPAAIRLYWTKASTGENWQDDWIGNTSVAGNNVPLVVAGGEITGPGIGVLPSIQPGEWSVIGIPWHPVKPQEYAPAREGDPIPNSVDVCLLARIQEYRWIGPQGLGNWTEKMMSIPELENTVVTPNIRNNNNIATKNFLIKNLDLNNRPARFQVDVANADQVATTFSLQFATDRFLNPQFGGNFSALGNVELSLGGLFDIWVHGGGVGSGIISDSKAKSVHWAGSGEMRLEGITLQPGERFPIDVVFNLDSRADFINVCGVE